MEEFVDPTKSNLRASILQYWRANVIFIEHQYVYRSWRTVVMLYL